MSMPEAMFFRIQPPAKTGEHVVTETGVGASAVNVDWVGALGANAPKGKVFLTLEARAQDVFVRFGPTPTTATTVSNGLVIKAGQKERFYCSRSLHRYIDAIAAAAGGFLKVQVSSKIGEREDV
jgi:hypothetical protein